MKFKFKIGQKVEDSISAFSGKITARCEYMDGTAQYLVVSPSLDDRGNIQSNWIMEVRLKSV